MENLVYFYTDWLPEQLEMVLFSTSHYFIIYRWAYKPDKFP